MHKQLPLYTPSNLDLETLEKFFVQRHDLLDRSVRWIRESIDGTKRNHLMFVGPRGSGKTQLTTMIVHRLKAEESLAEKMVIAWLGEDDIVTGYLDFVLQTVRALHKSGQYDMTDTLTKAKGQKTEEATEIMIEGLKRVIGDKTLLIVKENMGDVLVGLKDYGQKQLRSFLQENGNVVMLTTSQRLVKAVVSRDAVFFGFFDIHHLHPLSPDDAAELIAKVARYNDDGALEQYVQSSEGRYRIRALHHLAGGNHRLYMELMEFLTVESLDKLVPALSKLADELTPYFQERVKSLAPQQGLIVQKLCEIEGAITVKDLAEELFIGERSAAKQLGELRKMGYVLDHRRGKQTYYEMAEPLMRLSLQVKHARGKPLKILVLLLKAWFSDSELEKRKGSTSDDLLRRYIEMALENDGAIVEKITDEIVRDIENSREKDISRLLEEIGNVPNHSVRVVYGKFRAVHDIIGDLLKQKTTNIHAVQRLEANSEIKSIEQLLNELIIDLSLGTDTELEMFSRDFIGKSFFIIGVIYFSNMLYDLALTNFAKAEEYMSVPKTNQSTLFTLYKSKAISLTQLNKCGEAIKYFDLAMQTIDTENDRQIKTNLMFEKATCYFMIQDYKTAKKNYLELCKRSDLPEEEYGMVFFAIGMIYVKLKDMNEAKKYLQKAMKYIQKNDELKSTILSTIARVSMDFDESEKAEKYLLKIVAMDTIAEDWKQDALFRLADLYYDDHASEKAREAIERALQLPNTKEGVSQKWLTTLMMYYTSNQWQNEIEALVTIFAKYKKMEMLGSALMNSIGSLTLGDEALALFGRWEETWQEIGAQYEYLQPALKALKAAREAVEAGNDKPLFQLPKEIRDIVRPMIEELFEKSL